jgi:hypothetical protein
MIALVICTQAVTLPVRELVRDLRVGLDRPRE